MRAGKTVQHVKLQLRMPGDLHQSPSQGEMTEQLLKIVFCHHTRTWRTLVRAHTQHTHTHTFRRRKRFMLTRVQRVIAQRASTSPNQKTSIFIGGGSDLSWHSAEKGR